jgi:MOSC domain-containing protein YiiM
MAVDTRAWARSIFEGSELIGDAALHMSHSALTGALKDAEISFVNNWASLDALVVRCVNGSRQQPISTDVSVTQGLLGDRWAAGKAEIGQQLSMMNLDVAAAIANGQSIALFGDNIFTRLNLNEDFLEVGAVLRIGSSLTKVSETPHVPCDRFRARFGVASFERTAKQPRLRGVYLTVLEGGTIALGDSIRRA